MSAKQIGIGVAAVAAAGVIVAGGNAIANAASTPSPSPSTSAGPNGECAPGRDGGGQHTAATAAETAKVTAAVKAKDSAVTVTSVRKDADGSFDALGTKAGTPVFYEVSKDLKTVTERTRGPGGPGSGHGRSKDTAATAAETARVAAAVKAKDSAVTVTSVRKDADGSFDALGTKAGTPVFYEVSKDLKTVTLNDHAGAGGPGGRHGDAPGGPSGAPSSSPSPTS